MKKFRWQLLIIFLTGLVVGILLLSEQPENEPFAEPEPVKGGNYTEALVGSLQRLNPILDWYNPVDRDLDRLIFSRLFTFDERGNPMPDLVDAIGISQDGTVYNFSLRTGIKWHDGEVLTAEDVVFTVGLLREGGDIVPDDLQAFWAQIEVISAEETLVQFRLPEPFAPFFDYLTFGILPSHLLQGLTIDQIKNHEFNLEPVGSGPYQFDRLIVENDSITGFVLSAFSDYYNQQPFIDQLVFQYYPDSTSALQAYKDGKVQGVSIITNDVLLEALQQPDLALYTGRKPELSLILFNLKNNEKPYFQDNNVRRALYMGINRQNLVDKVLQGQAILADGPIFPGTWAYYDGIVRVEYNSDQAIQLLIDAGYTLPAEGGNVRTNEDGVTLTFTLAHPDTTLHTALAEAIKAQWSQLGIDVTLEPLPYDILLQERLESRTFDAVLVDLNLSGSPDPDPYPFWDQNQITSGQNYSGWEDSYASEYLEDARTTVDQIERTRLYRNFQVLFMEELPALPLFYPVYTYAVDNAVQGVQIGPLFETSDRFVTITDWYLVARVPTPTAANP